MTAFIAIRRGFEVLLEVITATLVVALTLLIIAGAVFRYSGASLTWYDEVASIGLVWLTYYGAALGALKGAHIGFPGIVNSMPPKLRLLMSYRKKRPGGPTPLPTRWIPMGHRWLTRSANRPIMRSAPVVMPMGPDEPPCT